MFGTIFENTAATTADVSIQLNTTLLCIMTSLLLGLIISIAYMLASRKKDRSPNFVLSLVILPALVAVVIFLVGSNIARAFSVAGVFALIRFRSIPGDSKDITFIFLCMAVGLTAGLGYLSLAVVITFILCSVILFIKKVGFGSVNTQEKMLKITIPEDMNYQNIFDDIFSKYTKECNMVRVKTTNLGTLYELSYDVVMKENSSEKEFIDSLRCRNGNLAIQLGLKENLSQQL